MDSKPTWPGWETVRLIGRGSFGVVYEIERDVLDLGEKEKAALKVITIPHSSDDIAELRSRGYDDASITETFKEYLKDIVSEYSLMRKLNGHTNIVNCDDVRQVQHDDDPGFDIFIKMELLTPLTKALGKEVSERQVLRIGSDICKALVLCAKNNIIHRDIKPANIFVSESGDYKLGDFGIAKTAEKVSTGTKIGTYEYMAPEVYHDQPYGSTADIYSLGMVLYWLLNDWRPPFFACQSALATAPEKEEARRRRFGGEPIPAPAHGSDELRRITLKACAFDPKERYQSAEDMLHDLEKIRDTITYPPMPVSERPIPEDHQTMGLFDKPVPDHKPHINGKRKKRIAILSGIIVLLALAVTAFFTIHIWEQPTCTEPAVCIICGKERRESAKGHDWGLVTYSSSKDGKTMTAMRVCKNDSAHIEKETVAIINEITTAPTCDKDGLKTYKAVFSNKAFQTRVRTEIIPMTGHNWSKVTYALSNDYSKMTASRVCNTCKKEQKETVKTTSKITVKPTCEKDGTCVYTAQFDGKAFGSHEETVKLAKTGHDWSKVTYALSKDYSKMTASRICNTCKKEQKETEKTTSKITVKPTCEKDGTCVYTAQFDGKAFGSHEETVKLAKTGHDWNPATYTTPKTCSVCGKTSGYAAKKTVPPTLDELKSMIKSGNYVTKSDKNVDIRIPKTKEYLTHPYRAEVVRTDKGRIFLIPIPVDDTVNRNGNLGVIEYQKQGWVVAVDGPFSFFISDSGKMGWNGSVYFTPLEQELSNYINVYVRKSYGTSVYAFADPNHTDAPLFIAEDGERGTALSEYKGFSYVFFPEKDRGGWVNFYYLATDPYVPDLSGKPSEADLTAVYAHIYYPSKDQYNPEYRKAVVTPKKGVGVYGFANPISTTNDFYFMVDKGEDVTILAEYKGFCCVILDNRGRAAWINNEYLK